MQSVCTNRCCYRHMISREAHRASFSAFYPEAVAAIVRELSNRWTSQKSSSVVMVRSQVCAAGVGTIAETVDIDASTNSTNNTLVYVSDVATERSGVFRLSLLYADAPVATLAGEAPIFLTVLPGPPLASASSVAFQGLWHTNPMCRNLCSRHA